MSDTPPLAAEIDRLRAVNAALVAALREIAAGDWELRTWRVRKTGSNRTGKVSGRWGATACAALAAAGEPAP